MLVLFGFGYLSSLITDDPFKMDLSKDLWPGFIPFIRKASPNSGGLSAVMSI
nr:MAG: hypothetical protein H2Rhizo3127127_000002 [Mitovirus sp.]